MARLPTIRKQLDFARLYSAGVRRRSPSMTVVVLRMEGSQQPRVAFVVSRRCGKAVVRNRVRRRLREAYRRLLPRIRLSGDLAIIAHPPAVEAEYWDLARTLERLLHLAGILRPGPEEGGSCEPSSSA